MIRPVNDIEYKMIISSLERIIDTFPWYPEAMDLEHLRVATQTDPNEGGNYIVNQDPYNKLVLHKDTILGDGLDLDLAIIQELNDATVDLPTPEEMPYDNDLTLEQNATAYAIVVEDIEVAEDIDSFYHTYRISGAIEDSPYTDALMQYIQGNPEAYYEYIRVDTRDNKYYRRYMDWFLSA